MRYDSTLSLVYEVLRHDHIVLQSSVEDELPAFSSRRQQIQEILMNLLTNARDALNTKYPGGDGDKRLLVSVAMVLADNTDWVRLTVEAPGGHLRRRRGAKLSR